MDKVDKVDTAYAVALKASRATEAARRLLERRLAIETAAWQEYQRIAVAHRRRAIKEDE
jgi:hypothetical protein